MKPEDQAVAHAEALGRIEGILECNWKNAPAPTWRERYILSVLLEHKNAMGWKASDFLKNEAENPLTWAPAGKAT